MSQHSFRPGWISQIFFYFGAYVIFSAWRANQHGAGELGDYFWAFLIAIPCFAVANWIATKDREKAMEDVNEIAVQSLENAIVAAERGLALLTTLYLRPFALTNKLRFDNPRPATMMTPEYYSQERVLDLETIMAEELMNSTPLIALGGPGELVGAGRLFSTEEDWQQKFQSLARAVKRILILPAPSAGTVWEMRWLREANLLYKCFFLMPPQPNQDAIDMSEYWSNTVERLAELGFELPPYVPQGEIYVMDSECCRIFASKQLDLHREGEFRKAMDFLERTQAGRRGRIEASSSGKKDEEVLPQSKIQVGRTDSTIEEGNQNEVVGEISITPRWRKRSTLSYYWIGAAFILASLLITFLTD